MSLMHFDSPSPFSLTHSLFSFPSALCHSILDSFHPSKCLLLLLLFGSIHSWHLFCPSVVCHPLNVSVQHRSISQHPKQFASELSRGDVMCTCRHTQTFLVFSYWHCIVRRKVLWSMSAHFNPEEEESRMFSETLVSSCKSTRRSNPEGLQRPEQNSASRHFLHLVGLWRCVLADRVQKTVSSATWAFYSHNFFSS
jgi:hypothetical protein